jgi:hypothetical protein
LYAMNSDGRGRFLARGARESSDLFEFCTKCSC